MTNKRKSFGKELETVYSAVQFSETVLNNKNIDNLEESKNINPSIDLEGSRTLSNNDDNNDNSEHILKQVSISKIFPGVYQPRKIFSEESLQELASSIKQQGIIQPIIVREKNDSYEIIAGERRFRAAQIVGLESIPIIICSVGDKSALAYALVENLQRKDLNPIEKAHAYLRMQKEFSQTHEQIAKLVGCSRATITNSLRLLFLNPFVKNLLKDNKIETGHARAMLVLDSAQQEDLAKNIIKNNMSVRDVENSVKKINSPDASQVNNLQKSENSFSKDQLEKNIDATANLTLDFKKESYNQYWSEKLSEYFNQDVKTNLEIDGSGEITIKIDNIKLFIK